MHYFQNKFPRVGDYQVLLLGVFMSGGNNAGLQYYNTNQNWVHFSIDEFMMNDFYICF